MGLPLFGTDGDPGPSFVNLLNSSGIDALAHQVLESDAPHATTVVALRYRDGVVLAADRQASMSYVASRDVRKIEPADSFTAVAISGVAAAGLQMTRLLQVSFEHYEKMQDSSLSLEGKANYLSPLIQSINLGGVFVVLPLLAGWDTNHRRGRVFSYDFAGGCYERDDYTVIGSGTPFAEGVLRLGYRTDLTLDEALDLAALAIYEAGDNDLATGGPDFVRRIFPMMVSVTADGFAEEPEGAVERRFRAILDRRTQTGGVAGGSLR